MLADVQDLQLGLVGILVVLAYGYFFMYLYYITRSYYILRGLPYSQFKCALIITFLPVFAMLSPAAVQLLGLDKKSNAVANLVAAP